MDKPNKIRRIARTLDKEDREDFEKNFDNILDINEPLSIFLKYEINEKISNLTKEIDFEDSNWTYRQAFLNGQINSLKMILELISKEDEE